MKLCKDCRWFEATAGTSLDPVEYAHCLYGIAPVEPDPVFGTIRQTKHGYCLNRRQTVLPDECGPDARFFEPKDPIAVCVETAMRDFLTDTVGLISECARCAEFDEVHDQNCPNHPDYDPTPWCSACGSRTKSGCHCGPIAENE